MNKSLKDSLDERGNWINTRASGVFPFYSSPEDDFYLVFQNYWLWKNKISVQIHITVYSEDGVLLEHLEFVPNMHNEVSVRDLIGDFEGNGILVAEVFSDNNVNYPFPALMYFSERNSGEYMTMVHTAGRVIGEQEKIFNSQNSAGEFQTNFSIVDQNGNVQNPYVHLFTDEEIVDSNVELAIYDKKNNEINRTIFKISLKKHGSKTIFIEDHFSDNDLARAQFAKIKTNITNVFNRWVVGQQSHDGFKSFTHSFGDYSTSADVFESTDEGYLYYYVPSSSTVLCRSVSFPTNSSSISGNLFYQVSDSVSENQKFLRHTKFTGDNWQLLTELENDSYWTFDMADNKAALVKADGNFPHRYNANYQFYLPNTVLSTDVATGFHSPLYKPSFSHWGAFRVNPSVENILFIRNYSPHDEFSQNSNCTISFFDSEDQKFEYDFVINPSTICELNVNKLLSESMIPSSKFISWKLKCSGGQLNVTMVGFNYETGAIYGEHAF